MVGIFLFVSDKNLVYWVPSVGLILGVPAPVSRVERISTPGEEVGDPDILASWLAG